MSTETSTEIESTIKRPRTKLDGMTDEQKRQRRKDQMKAWRERNAERMAYYRNKYYDRRKEEKKALEEKKKYIAKLKSEIGILEIEPPPLNKPKSLGRKYRKVMIPETKKLSVDLTPPSAPVSTTTPAKVTPPAPKSEVVMLSKKKLVDYGDDEDKEEDDYKNRYEEAEEADTSSDEDKAEKEFINNLKPHGKCNHKCGSECLK